MRIAFVVRALGAGGTERQLAMLSVGLHRRGHDVLIVQMFPGDHFVDEVRQEGVTVSSVLLRGRWDLLRLCRRGLTAIRRHRPDVVYGLHVESNLVALAAAASLSPRSFAVWGIRDGGQRPTGPLARALRILHDRLADKADLVVVNSYAGRAAAVAAGYPVERLLVIDNGVDTELFKPDLEARARVRREWEIDDAQHLIGAVARLASAKDHDTFLRAAAVRVRAGDPVVFACIGDGEPGHRALLEETADRYGLADRVRWCGARSDMPAVHNALDVCTVPSSAEGFSNAALEALACGVPCVVSDVGDHARLVPAAVVVPPGDPAALAEGWLRARDSTAQERAAARAWVEAAFSLDRCLDETERALAKLATGPRAGSRSAFGAARSALPPERGREGSA